MHYFGEESDPFRPPVYVSRVPDPVTAALIVKLWRSVVVPTEVFLSLNEEERAALADACAAEGQE